MTSGEFSTDLVPLGYARDTFNTQYGTNLREHNDRLTAEQAASINDSCDIEVRLGSHGIISENASDVLSMSPDELLELPTRREYDEAAAVVAGMELGDTLFLERYGFIRPESKLNQSEILVRLMEAKVAGLPNAGTSREFGLFAQLLLEGGRAMARQELEAKRYRISAWEYAESLANLKGIKTVYADYDAFGRQSFEKLSAGRNILQLMGSPDAEDRSLAERIHEVRELRARNVVKNYALEHLPTGGVSEAGGRKPKLVLLFGAGHEEGLRQAFDDIGLNVNMINMEQSSDQERAAEQSLRWFGSLAVAATSSLAGQLPPVEASTLPRQSSRQDSVRSQRPLGDRMERFRSSPFTKGPTA